MAPGCEPASVRAMMGALRPLVLGQSMAGAGGGGFLYLLTREPGQQQAVMEILSSTPVRNRPIRAITPQTHKFTVITRK